MSKVENGEAIQKAELDHSANGSLPGEKTHAEPEQSSEAEEIMSLEIALVRALQQLGQTSDKSQPLS
jgi:hypothetical protein